MSVHPADSAGPPIAAPTSGPQRVSRSGRARSLAVAGLRMLVKTVVVVVLSAGALAGLVVAGLDIGPGLGTVEYAAAAPPRRPPIIPPSVPPGAREDWAIWSYVDKINQAWGKDWPLVITWFEELNARYPGNSMVLDKLYVAYLEDGRIREMVGDIPAARHRYEQAARFDPDRGVAQERLTELNQQRTTVGR